MYNLIIKIHMRGLEKVVVIHILNYRDKKLSREKKSAAKTRQSVLFPLFQINYSFMYKWITLIGKLEYLGIQPRRRKHRLGRYRQS